MFFTLKWDNSLNFSVKIIPMENLTNLQSNNNILMHNIVTNELVVNYNIIVFKIFRIHL